VHLLYCEALKETLNWAVNHHIYQDVSFPISLRLALDLSLSTLTDGSDLMFPRSPVQASDLQDEVRPIEVW
jgi:hypothetical protein